MTTTVLMILIAFTAMSVVPVFYYFFLRFNKSIGYKRYSTYARQKTNKLNNRTYEQAVR